MTEYLAWWILGGLVGMGAGCVVLRSRAALTPAIGVVFFAAAVGCLYGAKVQYRLRFFPPVDAILVPPGELFTPGFHIPLGLACGALGAMIACRLLRVPVVHVLDALAMAGAVMMPIGRIGCLRAGCCLGITCPRWMDPVCIAPDSAGILTAAVGGDVRVHALPVYFGLLGLLLATAYVVLLRRRVAPGTLIVVALSVYPLGQLAIERLRPASDDRGPAMTIVLLGMMAVDVLGAAWWYLQRSERRPLLRHRVPAAIAVALLAVAAAVPARAAVDPAQWQAAIQAYAQNPRANARMMIALGRDASSGLPPAYAVLVADAQLRAGHLRTADRLFDQMLARDPGEPWAGFAALGRGWIAVRRGRLDYARSHFADAASAQDSNGLLGDLLVGLLDAQRGTDADSIARFDAIAANPAASEDLQLAAMMAGGYARFWAGDDAGARDVFRTIAARADGKPAADDARYGAALAQWRAGDADGAADVLHTLAAGAPKHGAHVDRASANLDPKGLVRIAARRYRSLPPGMPSDLVLSMLTGDAPAAARVTLRRLEAGAAPPSPLAGRTPSAGRHDQALGPPGGAGTNVPRTSGMNEREPATHTEHSHTMPVSLATAVLALAVALWRMQSQKPVRR